MSEGSLWMPTQISREYFIVQWNLYGPILHGHSVFTWGMVHFVLNFPPLIFYKTSPYGGGGEHFREADIYYDLAIVR